MRDHKYAIEIMKQELGNKYISPRIKYAFEASIEALEKQINNGWIPCSERLPEKKEYLKNDGRFIVTDGNRRYQGWFDIYDGHFAKPSRDDIMKEDKCVIAWQPLPSPYKPKED